MKTLRAYAKVNLALVVGASRPDGRHEVVSLLERVALHDDVALRPSPRLVVDGFLEDTLVGAALTELAAASGTEPAWHVRMVKRIPVAAGLGGGSADAAAALLLANRTLAAPLPADELHALASRLGADIPFFLRPGAQLATGDGTSLQRAPIPTDYHVVLVLPLGVRKASTEAVYRAFDEREGQRGFAERRAALLESLDRMETPCDLAGLPANDLATSSLSERLLELGAFRADVTGAGPVVYGLFEELGLARAAAAVLRDAGRTWLTRPLGAAGGPEWQDDTSLWGVAKR